MGMSVKINNELYELAKEEARKECRTITGQK
jgi:hypothetical protein